MIPRHYIGAGKGIETYPHIVLRAQPFAWGTSLRDTPQIPLNTLNLLDQPLLPGHGLGQSQDLSWRCGASRTPCDRATWCAQSSWYDPVAWFACLDYDVGNVAAGGIKGELPPPTVTPGTGTPQLPSNYDPNTGQCRDTSGAVAPCATDTPAKPIQYTTPVPPASADSTCDAWYCTYLDIGCDTCSLFGNTTTLVLIAAALGLGAFYFMSRGNRR